VGAIYRRNSDAGQRRLFASPVDNRPLDPRIFRDGGKSACAQFEETDRGNLARIGADVFGTGPDALYDGRRCLIHGKNQIYKLPELIGLNDAESGAQIALRDSRRQPVGLVAGTPN
jgi:hypothetical protein